MKVRKIIFNILASPKDYDDILKDINLAFTSVFITEAAFKLLAFGITGYFKNVWN